MKKFIITSSFLACIVFLASCATTGGLKPLDSQIVFTEKNSQPEPIDKNIYTDGCEIIFKDGDIVALKMRSGYGIEYLSALCTAEFRKNIKNKVAFGPLSDDDIYFLDFCFFVQCLALKANVNAFLDDIKITGILKKTTIESIKREQKPILITSTNKTIKANIDETFQQYLKGSSSERESIKRLVAYQGGDLKS